MANDNNTQKASRRWLIILVTVMTVLLLAGIAALVYGLWQTAQQL